MLKLATKFAPQREHFEVAYRAGHRNAEIWLNAAALGNAAAIVQLAGQYPLRYALHFPNRGELDDSALFQCVRLYQQLRCTALVIHVPMYERYGERLLNHDSSLRLAVENHDLPAHEFGAWAERYRGLTLDIEHLWKYTLADAPLSRLARVLEEFLDRFADKLLHVHLPGYLPGQPEHRPMYCSRDMVFRALSALEAHRFQGLIVSEADLGFQNPNDLRMDVLLFDRWRELQQERQPAFEPQSPQPQPLVDRCDQELTPMPPELDGSNLT